MSTGHGTRRRLAVARFSFEGNRFAPMPADQAAFERAEWLSGDAALTAARGTATELGAVAAFAEEHADWEIVVLRCASALPAGPIEDAVFDRIMADVDRGLAEGLAAGGWDAVYLSLHGAAITATRATPDLELVRCVRQRLPGIALGASFDLHANMVPELAALLDVASVYRTHPHVDMAATAERVLGGLRAIADGGLTTRRVLRRADALLPSFNMRTADGPMRDIETAARALERGAVREVAVFGGFPYADTAHAGASVLAVSDTARDPDGRAATQAAESVAALIGERASEFEVELPRPAAAIAAALADPRPGPIAITDPADNPLSGGGCDTPGLFRALLDARVEVPTLFASFADPRAVAAARRAGIGGTVEVTLGARHGVQFGAGVALRATVERLTDGAFTNRGPMATGVERRCGGSAVLVVGDQRSVRVIVTAEVVPADDPAFYDLHGVDLAALRLLCVKAKNHFRAGAGSACTAIIPCDAPGPAAADLAQLDFRHLRARRRPVRPG